MLPAAQCLAAQEKKIRVGLPTTAPPFAFFDKKLSTTRGFCVDLALMAGKVLHAQIEFYGYNDQELNKALRKGQIDVIGCTFNSPDLQSDIQLIDTGMRIDRHLFAHKSCLTVTCLKDLPTHRIVDSSRQQPHLSGFSSSSVDLVVAVSPEEALSILDAGRADIYISPNSLTTLYQIQKLGFANIKQVGLPFETVPLSLAVLKERADLLSDLSLTLGKIQEGEHYQALKNKWFGRDIKISIWERYIKYVLMAAAGLALILLLFAAWNLALKRQVTSITADLVASEQKYRELIESSPDMIHIISADGLIRMTNARSKELLDKENGPATERFLTDLVVPDQKEDMRYFIISLFENGYGENEFVFMDGENKTIPVEIVATTLKDTHPPNRIAACFSRDLRVRKSLEEELIRSERLAIMGQMSAGLAHEINNPLGIISSYAQDLLGGEVDEATRLESLNVIANNAERAGRIISGLLSFSRHDQPVRTPVDVADILEASLLFVKLEMKRKRVSVRKTYATDPVVIFGDENQLVQVFVNLLINAIQAVQEKGILSISYAIAETDDQMAVIAIQDNGSGIKSTELEKLFQPFYSTKETGFGLGLFISSMIVERHHGTIRAESQEGYGTTMRIYLPLCPVPKNLHPRELHA